MNDEQRIRLQKRIDAEFKKICESDEFRDKRPTSDLIGRAAALLSEVVAWPCVVMAVPSWEERRVQLSRDPGDVMVTRDPITAWIAYPVPRPNRVIE